MLSFLLALVLLMVSAQSFVTMPLASRQLRMSKDLRMTSSIASLSLEVQDLKKSTDFYVDVVGMKVLADAISVDDGKQVQLSFESSTEDVVLELVEKPTFTDSRGDGFVGIGMYSSDATSVFGNVEQKGGRIVMELKEYGYGASLIPDEDELKIKPVTYGTFTDPDGYLIEVEQREKDKYNGNFKKIIMNVLDLDDAIDFYTKPLGMQLLRKRANINSIPKRASFVAFMGYNKNENIAPYVELVYNYATDKLDVGKQFSGTYATRLKRIAMLICSCLKL